jgi:hypothetical protein
MQLVNADNIEESSTPFNYLNFRHNSWFTMIVPAKHLLRNNEKCVVWNLPCFFKDVWRDWTSIFEDWVSIDNDIEKNTVRIHDSELFLRSQGNVILRGTLKRFQDSGFEHISSKVRDLEKVILLKDLFITLLRTTHDYIVDKTASLDTLWILFYCLYVHGVVDVLRS